jgi:hypothetical protein
MSNSGAIDWADEDGGLPSIDGLHATFGKSGSATPVTPAETGEEVQELATVNGIHTNGVSITNQQDDGFTQARGGRVRTRGFRGDRGSGRGVFRGGRDRGFRGGFRSGDRERSGK